MVQSALPPPPPQSNLVHFRVSKLHVQFKLVPAQDLHILQAYKHLRT
jgi:hypothetical protein